MTSRIHRSDIWIRHLAYVCQAESVYHLEILLVVLTLAVALLSIPTYSVSLSTNARDKFLFFYLSFSIFIPNSKASSQHANINPEGTLL